MAIPILNLPRINLPSESILRAEKANLTSSQSQSVLQQTQQRQQQFLIDQENNRIKQEREQALNSLRQEAVYDSDALNELFAVDPKTAEYIQTSKDNQTLRTGRAATAVKVAPLPQKPIIYKKALQDLANNGIDISDFPAEWSPEIEPEIEYIINRSRDIEKQLDQERGVSNGKIPSAVREFQFYKSLPTNQQQEFLNVKRNVLQTGLGLTPEGKVEALPNIGAAKEEIKAAESRGEATGKLDVERRKNLAKANTALKSLETQSNVVTKNIDKALGTINAYSTGYGSFLSFLPNTDAKKLKLYLDTIKANVGFDKLQQMRDNSPTGGALGQVSEMENKLLQAVNGVLDPSQADLLEANLKDIKSLYPKLLKERQDAFNQDYGKYIPETQKTKSTKPIKRYNKKTGRLE